MPKYYCEYCDIYLTHSSAGGRRQHNSGRKHINNKIEYYQTLIREKNLTPPMYPVPPHLAAAIRPPMMQRPMPMPNAPPMPLPGMTPIPGGASRPQMVLPGQIRPVAAPMGGGKIGGTNWVTNWGGKIGGQVSAPHPGGKGAPIAAPNPLRPPPQAGKGQPLRPPIVLPGQNNNNPPGTQLPITSKIVEAPKGLFNKGPPGFGKTGIKQAPVQHGLSDKGPGKFGGGKSPSMMGGKDKNSGGKSPGGMMGKDFKGGKMQGGGKFQMQPMQPGKGKW